VGVIDGIKFFFFHHHHYIDVPEDDTWVKSTWVDTPAGLYDAHKAHALYQRHLRTMLRAEQLGFDGITINEHHNTLYSLTPATGLMGAALVARTSTCTVQVAGVPINFSTPNRLAEEYAMLDVMSGGRMEYAFPLGTGMEYWSNGGAVNPVTSRARMREGLEVLKQAWTAEGPTRFDGEFFNFRFLNVWPRPLQKPHPKMFIVGSGSKETVELAVEMGAGYSTVFVPIPNQIRAFDYMRKLAEAKGRAVVPDDLIIVVIAYVADTDEEAVQEARPHIEKFFSWFHRVPAKWLLPPGYVSTEEFLRRAQDAAMADGQHASWDDMVAIGRIACGSPDTVADTIVRWCEEAGVGRVNVVLEHGDMPEWKTVKNMDLFAKEVMPRVRARLGGASVAEGRGVAAEVV